jgi:hypothetical protein
LEIDDRDEIIARLCLLISTLSIEHFCKRKLLRKKHVEQFDFQNGFYLPLREYPVSELQAVFLLGTRNCKPGYGELLDPDFYSVIPDCSLDMDLPFAVELSQLVRRSGCKAVMVYYYAGYTAGKVPADLSSACMELAAWNFNRFKNKFFGMASNEKEEFSFEKSMPENVKALLEPYKRKTI